MIPQYLRFLGNTIPTGNVGSVEKLVASPKIIEYAIKENSTSNPWA
jgi:hypothetical protein